MLIWYDLQTQGKPTLLQKRKHQIHFLAWDAKQRELELIERKSQAYVIVFALKVISPNSHEQSILKLSIM
jgi:hypothetical protein